MLCFDAALPLSSVAFSFVGGGGGGNGGGIHIDVGGGGGGNAGGVIKAASEQGRCLGAFSDIGRGSALAGVGDSGALSGILVVAKGVWGRV